MCAPAESALAYFVSTLHFASGERGLDDHADDRTAPAVAVEARPVDFDLRCIHCGYNLRGLPRDGRCPECGDLVSDSPVDDALHASDAAWLSSIARGATLLYVSCLVLISTFIVTVLIFFLAAPGAVGLTVVGGLETVVAVVVPLLFLAGVILLTRQEPRAVMTEPRGAWRPLSRWSMILMVAAVFIFWVIETFSLPIPGGQSSVVYETAANIFMTTIISAFVICMTRYCSQLVLRVPDGKLARQLRTRGTGFVVCYVLLVAMQVFAAISLPGGMGPRPAPAGIAGGGIWMTFARLFPQLGVLIFVIALMSSAGRLRREFRKCVKKNAQHRLTARL